MRGHLHLDGEPQLLSALPAIRLPLLQEEQGDQEEVLCVVSYILQCAKVTPRLLVPSPHFCDLKQTDTFSVRRYLFLLNITNSTVVFCCFGHASPGSVGGQERASSDNQEHSHNAHHHHLYIWHARHITITITFAYVMLVTSPSPQSCKNVKN